MKRLWTQVNYNADGSPLLGVPGAGLVGILIAVGALIRGFFF